MRRIGFAGFTMIELLVVIAIIAILAAIIFPVAARAKDAAYRSSDMSHMNALRSALQLYRTDQGGYPPLLFSAVQTYGGTAIPANQTVDYLYPKRITDISTFQPANDRSAYADIFPSLNVTSCANPQPGSSQPCVVWPGAPVTSPASPVGNCASRAYGYDTAVTSDLANPSDTSATPQYFYKVDGYDVAPVKNSDGSTRYELHYSLFWTGYGIGFNNGSNSCVSGGLAGNAADNPRQLGYANPPDTTVITWDTYFRDYDSNNSPVNYPRDIVLFLGGNAKMYSSLQVATNPWDVSP